MMERVRRTGLFVTMSALVGVVGCGGVPEEVRSEAPGQLASRMTVALPDFVVSSVSGPASVWEGNSFRATVTVCNQGGVGGGTDVELFLSQDADITGSDTSLAGMPVGWLEPGQCATSEVFAGAYVTGPGVWYLGAIVDRYDTVVEVDESNNARVGTRMGVGDGPDFIVQTVAGPASVMMGGGFMASVTVCNQGTNGGVADVELLLSSDEVIGADLSIGGFGVGWLNPSQCITQQVPVSASVPSEGAWFLGAVADPFSSQVELIEDNNAKTGARMGVGYGPDFVVREVSGPASVFLGENFQGSVTVCNQGTLGGNAEVDLFLSADESLAAEDIFIGGLSAGWLEAGQCTTQVVPAYASAPSEGAWYLGAIADPRQYAQELIEDNNAKTGTRMGVGYGPDFMVREVSGPPSVGMGSGFTVSVTVCNQGTAGGSADADVFVSSDDTITGHSPEQPSGDVLMGNVYLGWLEPGQCATQPLWGHVYPPSEGAWYLGALVDPWHYTQELREDNNARTGALMGVGSRPDLVVEWVRGPTSVRPYDTLLVDVRICNQGTLGTYADAELLLSKDPDIRHAYDQSFNEDLRLATAYVGWLEPGQCASQQVPTGTWVPEEGPWYLGAIADFYGSTPELIESNNQRAADSPTGIGNAPDFVVREVSGPASVVMGGSFTASVTVCNQGTLGGSTDVELFLSSDDTITGPSFEQPYADPFVGSVHLGWLEPGQCATGPVSAHPAVPSEGAWYLGAIVDPRNTGWELREDNNAKAGTRMGVGYRPDFVVREVSGPASVMMSSPLTVSVTVCNQGTMAGGTDVELFLSADDTISGYSVTQPYHSDHFLGGVFVGALEPGQCTTRSVPVHVSVPNEGAWYLGAIADPRQYTQELIEDNNAKAGGLVGVGSRPDFVVREVSGPASVVMGGSLTASVTVCNQGTLGGHSEVDLFLSSDETITAPSPTQSYNVDHFLGTVFAGWLEPGQCVTQTLPTNAYVPSEGVWYLGAIADPRDMEPELREDNNAKADALVGVGTRPDFVVQEVSGPASVVMGGSLTASVTVCNQGTLGGSSEVDLFLSADETITAPSPTQSYDVDHFLGTAYLGWLEPGQCGTQTLPTNAYVPSEGVWYLGAIADPRDMELELREDNNAKAGTRLGVGSRPDFVVQAVSGPASVVMGGSLTASITVCNQGTLGGATDVEVFFSADQTIKPYSPERPYESDHFLGGVHMGWLEPGQCATQAMPANAYAPNPGDWYLGAIADPRNMELELLEDNNTSLGGIVQVLY